MSKDYSKQKLREQNLQKIFGDTCFEKIICLDTGEDKDRILKEYQDSGYLWIEDKVQNQSVDLNMVSTQYCLNTGSTWITNNSKNIRLGSLSTKT